MVLGRVLLFKKKIVPINRRIAKVPKNSERGPCRLNLSTSLDTLDHKVSTWWRDDRRYRFIKTQWGVNNFSACLHQSPSSLRQFVRELSIALVNKERGQVTLRISRAVTMNFMLEELISVGQVVFLCLLQFGAFLVGKAIWQKNASNLPPGPWGIPIIGETFQTHFRAFSSSRYF